MSQLINIAKKVRFSWKLKKRQFWILNCNIFEFLMKYQFDFKDIIINSK